MRPTQGALQRLIWYSRQGRVRLANMLSLHERSRNAFCSAIRVRLTAPAEANGPKYDARLVARAAELGQLRELVVGGEVDERKRLVVAQQHVVARHQPLDQVAFEQQRLGLGRRSTTISNAAVSATMRRSRFDSPAGWV